MKPIANILGIGNEIIHAVAEINNARHAPDTPTPRTTYYPWERLRDMYMDHFRAKIEAMEENIIELTAV